MKWKIFTTVIGLFGCSLGGAYAQSLLQQIENHKQQLPYLQLSDSLLEYAAKLRQPMLPAAQTEKIRLYNSLLQRYKDSVALYAQAHAGSVSASELLFYNYFTLSPDTDFLREHFKPVQQKGIANPYAQYLQQEINGLDSARAGMPLPVFQLPDRQNVLHSISKGKKTLLLFWASWCAPCRAENRQLKALYPQLQSRNVDIVSISLDDDKSSWLNAARQDALPWLDLWSVDAWDSRPARFFTLHQIPQNALLNADGVIEKRNVQNIMLEVK